MVEIKQQIFSKVKCALYIKFVGRLDEFMFGHSHTSI